ncbi:nuclear transport factor 2 family protein [Dactylosporangium cerinum]|uniref:Nuclear transport factor 2 family protein n=1 Tax=Dactylosporangium cerinum TaxID=1434730 RepID=A0ABV9VQH3_9ACTN
MTVETELEQLEEEMWRANREGDGSFYDRVVRDDALVVSKYGVAGKADIVPTITKNENPFLKTTLADLKVLRISDDSALVTYKATVTALISAAERTFQVLATSVYTRDGDEWRSVFHQQTEV